MWRDPAAVFGVLWPASGKRALGGESGDKEVDGKRWGSSRRGEGGLERGRGTPWAAWPVSQGHCEQCHLPLSEPFPFRGSHSGLCGDEEMRRGVGTGARTSAGLSLGLRETGRLLAWVTEGTVGHLLSKTGRLRGQAFGGKSSKLMSHNVTGIGLQMATDVRPCPSSRFLC